VLEYRITKYDPVVRSSGGTYTEWTSFSDIGQTFCGVPLTHAEYQRVENAYITSALSFLRDSGVTSLSVRGLENHGEALLGFGIDEAVSLEQIETILPRVLREEFWCKFEGPDSFIHVGYDYYMYIGVPLACPKSEHLAATLGLFVEPFRSPYGGRDSA
jgi:hypothetical protein